MKNTSTLLFSCLFPLMMTGGCKKHESAATSAPSLGSGYIAGSGASAMAGSGSAAMAGSGSAAMVGSGSAVVAAPDVPTAADFETQATTDITDKNLESQLDKIEKDLGK